MGNTIDSASNIFYRSLFGAKVKSPSELTKEDLEKPLPEGIKIQNELVLAKDLFESPTEEQKKIFNEFWVNDAILDVSGEKHDLQKSLLIESGHSNEQADSILDFSEQNVYRAIDWAEANEYYGNIGSIASTGTIALGVAKHLLDHESTPKLLRTAVNLAYGATKSTRSYTQYTTYNREDDDAGLNRFQAEYYGNKVDGVLANASTFTETKINSWAYALVELLPEKFSAPIKKLLALPTSTWWRDRMLSNINQRFSTDLFKWLVHKIPAMFGRKESIEIINEIKKEGNISPSYVREKHYRNAGLTEKKDQNIFKFFTQLFKLTKNTISNKDIETRKDASKKLAATVATSLGAYGMVAGFIGNGIGSVLKIFGYENKFFDFASAASITSQQFIYFPKIVMPFFNETKELELKLSNKESLDRYSSQQIKELKKLVKQRKNLCGIGISALVLNVLNTSLKLKTFENLYLQKGTAILDDVSSSLVNKFFSQRRYLFGHQFKLDNPEFYLPTEETQAKDIELAVV